MHIECKIWKVLPAVFLIYFLLLFTKFNNMGESLGGYKDAQKYLPKAITGEVSFLVGSDLKTTRVVLTPILHTNPVLLLHTPISYGYN